MSAGRAAAAPARAPGIGRGRAGRWRRAALVGYVVALHAVIVFMAFKTDFFLRVGQTLRLQPPPEIGQGFLEALVDGARRDRAVAPGSVVLLGDSIVAQVDARAVASGTVNFGLPGDTTRTLLMRLSTLRSADAARLVVLGIGVNDLKYRPPAEIAQDYAQVLRALPAAVPVVAISVLPVDESAATVRERPYLRNARIAELNAGLAAACAARAGCRFVDTRPDFADASGQLRAALHRGDGWHLSAQGAQTYARMVARAL